MSGPDESQHDQVIGEYRLIRKLGAGGFGTVYLAEHIHEHSQVAIKVLQVPLTKSEDFRDFINETRTMIRLHHPHIVPLLDVGLSSEGFPFLVMEYATEGTLRDRHPEGSQVPLVTIAEYVEQIASALQYAHDRRIIHRDIKPENLLSRADGTLLLSDFGIAKIIEQSTLMSMQKQIGTPAYIAPEQYKGQPCFASDQYSLAVMVYEWVSGTRPFQGNLLGLVAQHMTGQPPSLLNGLPTLHPGIEQAIFKALSKEPEQRYKTVQEFATALRDVVQQSIVAQIDTQKLPLDDPSSKEPLIQEPVALASIAVELQVDNLPTPQPPVTKQSIESDSTHTRQALASTSSPLPSNEQYEASSTPATPSLDQPSTLLPVERENASFKNAQASKHISPLKIILSVGTALLVVLLILALIINGVSRSSNKGVTSSTLTSSTLNANTVSHLVKKWAFQTGSRVASSPTLANGQIYVASGDNLYAIDAQSGREKWEFQAGSSIHFSSSMVIDGVVCVGTADGNVYAIDRQSGQKKWTFQTGSSQYATSFMVVDGVVYVRSNDGNMYAIDAQSGQQKWVFQTQGPHYVASFMVMNGIVYVGFGDSHVYAIDGQSGQEKWVFQTGHYLDPSSLKVVDGVVYISSGDSVYAIDGQSGQEKWMVQMRNSEIFPLFRSFLLMVVGGVVYIDFHDAHNNDNLYAIDEQSGQEKWVFQTGSSQYASSLMVVDGVVYLGNGDSVYAIDGQSGQKKWTFQTGKQERLSPVLGDGIVYVGSTDHNVYAIDARSGQKKWTFQVMNEVTSLPAVVDGVVYIGADDDYMYAIDAHSSQKKWAFQMAGRVTSSPVVIKNVVYVGSDDGNVYAFGLPTTIS